MYLNDPQIQIHLNYRKKIHQTDFIKMTGRGKGGKGLGKGGAKRHRKVFRDNILFANGRTQF